MKRLFANFWKIIELVFFNHGLLNGFISHDQISAEISKKSLHKNISYPLLNLYLLALYLTINFCYLWMFVLSSISEIIYEAIENSINKSQSFFEPHKKIDPLVQKKWTKLFVSKWYIPKFDGLTLQLILSNIYIKLNA